jgi:uncharacterized protein (TIRG00374 family)
LLKSPDTARIEQDRLLQAGKLGQRVQVSRSRGIHLLLGTLASGVFLYLTLRGVDLAEMWRELQIASPVSLGMAIGVGMVSNIFRAVRWKAIFGVHVRVRFRFLFTSMMIGYLANNLLPARMGDLVRIYTLERKTGVSKSTSLATVVLERLTDTLVLLILVIVTSFFLPLPAVVRSGSQMAVTVFAALAVLLLFLALRGENLLRLANLGARSFGIGQRLQGVVERFVDGLSMFRSSKQALFTFALTAVIWGLEALSVGLVTTSLALSLPWIASLILLVVLGLSFIIPAAPGAVGTYEFFAVTALTPFAMENSQAVGLALILHAIAYLTSTVLGLACLWTESLSLRELMIKAPKEDKA